MSSSSSPFEPHLDPGIDPGVENIEDKDRDRQQIRVNDRGPYDHRRVKERNGLKEGPSESGPVKDRFQYDGPGPGTDQAENASCQNRRQGRPQDTAPSGPPRRPPRR